MSSIVPRHFPVCRTKPVRGNGVGTSGPSDFFLMPRGCVSQEEWWSGGVCRVSRVSIHEARQNERRLQNFTRKFLFRFLKY